MFTVSEGKGLAPGSHLYGAGLSAARQLVILVSGSLANSRPLQRLLIPNEPAARTPARLVGAPHPC